MGESPCGSAKHARMKEELTLRHAPSKRLGCKVSPDSCQSFETSRNYKKHLYLSSWAIKYIYSREWWISSKAQSRSFCPQKGKKDMIKMTFWPWRCFTQVLTNSKRFRRVRSYSALSLFWWAESVCYFLNGLLWFLFHQYFQCMINLKPKDSVLWRSGKRI